MPIDLKNKDFSLDDVISDQPKPIKRHIQFDHIFVDVEIDGFRLVFGKSVYFQIVEGCIERRAGFQTC